MHLLGVLALHARQHDQAVEWFTRAIRKHPKAEYLSSLGIALKQQGRLDEALRVFDKAVQLKPDDAELWKHLAGGLAALGRVSEALLSYQHALKLDPSHWEAAYESGLLFYQSGRFDEALLCFERCDDLRPEHAPTLQMHARTLRALKRYEDYLTYSQRAHDLDATDPANCNNIGDALTWLGRVEEGLMWYDKALELRPDFVDVLVNKAFALVQAHRFDEALSVYERVKTLDPNNSKSAFHLSHLHLLRGDFEDGWTLREARWKVTDFSPDYPRFAQPAWLGEEAIKGKAILIHADEGIGDTIQFARYVPTLAARGARIILRVQDALCPLLSGLPGVVQCLPFSNPGLPSFDMHCPVMSLPLAFGSTLETIPSATYLPPLSPERLQVWRDRLGSNDRLRVGLVWSGNAKQANDRNRSMPFSALRPLLDLGATFVTLQKDPRPDDRTLLNERSDIVDLTAHLTDFAETAALVSNLDLVITVCTSVAHLAGALGRPTWIMLPYLPDWRWLLDREDSPWYPTARLFRQDENCSYARVVDRVRTELIAELAKAR